MFGISGEHLLILAVVLIFFGPKRLPEAGRVLGKTIRNFKDHFNGIHEPKFTKLSTTTIKTDGDDQYAKRA